MAPDESPMFHRVAISALLPPERHSDEHDAKWHGKSTQHRRELNELARELRVEISGRNPSRGSRKDDDMANREGDCGRRHDRS
jgi:hypothetical protein